MDLRRDDYHSYGRFSKEGREFVIHDPHTPRPWSNMVANQRVGLAVSQSGSGFTWIDNSQLAVITRWEQDFAQDTSGKFLFLRDLDSGEAWSLSPAPMWTELDGFECRHGIGYTTIRVESKGIESEWTLLVHREEPVELWHVRLRNLTPRPRRLALVSYLEWNCGVAPSPRREFHKLFLETDFEPDRRSILAWNHMWDIPSKRFGHWNADFPYIAAFATSAEVESAEGEKSSFLGRNGSIRNPHGLREETWGNRFGRHYDPIGAMRSRIDLEPDGETTVGFALAMEVSREAALDSADAWSAPAAIEVERGEMREAWRERLEAHRMETGDGRFDALINDWVRYQAIAARLWGRCGYYQQSGAFGFRDQLQDSQVWLTIDPKRCHAQILLHAAHQFADGSVYHWWHPLSEQGLVTTMTDDLLWLPFVTSSYLKETGDMSILFDAIPFLDEDGAAPLHEHVRRAFERVFRRTSERGLPYIGAGDWNDGLSAAGVEERGESVWLGHFLAGLLSDWREIGRRGGRTSFTDDYDARRESLVEAINTHGWDGDWYWRATLDDGTKLGSAGNDRGSIFLNAQTWAILNDVAPPDRARRAWAAVRERLVTDVGALLLTPAYDRPVPEIGYITRYAPGMRENGGVYTHAATWAIAAAAKMKDVETVGRLLQAIDPTNKDPERYWAEPYVLPGNVDGPESPLFGRAGWTWYTGSASWLHRVVSEWVFGVRPEWEGLRIDPCLPAHWPVVRMTRPWRGAVYDIRIERDSRIETQTIELDGTTIDTAVLAVPKQGAHHKVVVKVP
ncbi:MAG: glycosyl transferase family 36 [Acidobacteria bacterium]|nr:glycosyl transferase family 36 [Acidobacteriota bacterium]